jgi:RNA polymerase sigma-70 factor (ECF subfamily)
MQPRRPEIDELTLARARRGDDAACRAVFRHYQRAVYCLAWRMLGRRANPALAEDLTQETFLRVFRSLAGFTSDGTARLSTWILTIATRLALNEQRNQRRAIVATTPATEEPIANTRADEAAHRRAIGAVLEREIAKLTPDHRAVFLLREYHELDYAEIARVLEIELGTVQSRLSRARAALRLALEDIR